MPCHNSVSSKIKVFNSVIWVVSYSKIQSVLCCIHCWLPFDWAMPECTFGLEKLLHNAVFPVASWKLGFPLSFTFCELYAAGEPSLNQKPVMMRASVLFVYIYFFYSRSTNSIQWHMAFIYMVIKAYFFVCFLAVCRAETRTLSFLKVPV